jgi:hypothetical protein
LINRSQDTTVGNMGRGDEWQIEGDPCPPRSLVRTGEHHWFGQCQRPISKDTERIRDSDKL